MKQVVYAIGSISIGVFLNFTPNAFETRCDVQFQNEILKDVVYEIERDTVSDKVTIHFPELEYEK